MSRPRLSFANTTSVLALVVALGGGAYAVTSHSPGRADAKVLRGCVDRHSGELRIVKAGHRCGKGESAVKWNKLGPVGATGPAGAPGAAGATKVVVRTKVLPSLAGGAFTNDFVVCAAGERAVAGGASFESFSGKELLSQSYPVSAGGAPSTAGSTPAGWRSHVFNNTAFAVTPVVYAVCAAP